MGRCRQNACVESPRLSRRKPTYRTALLNPWCNGCRTAGLTRAASIEMTKRCSDIDGSASSTWPAACSRCRTRRADTRLSSTGKSSTIASLRDELKSRGCVFRTDSDTEVLLQAYEVFGEQAPRSLTGNSRSRSGIGRRRRSLPRGIGWGKSRSTGRRPRTAIFCWLRRSNRFSHRERFVHGSIESQSMVFYRCSMSRRIERFTRTCTRCWRRMR